MNVLRAILVALTLLSQGLAAEPSSVVYAQDDHGNAKTASVPLLAKYPAPPPWEPDSQQREHLRRFLTLLQTSTATDRKTVRVLFYGQSITQQAWWKEVERYLRSTYTNANLIIENRAIGGHSSQLLVKTAEADLYPFQPDLLIFHVYGSHVEYENILRRVRERTCADILLQTDHITQDTSMTEETDPAKLTPKQWDPWMNHVFLPTTAAKYGACRADIHELWKTYLQAHYLKAADLLRDGVHLNAQGEWLMAELLKAYLAPLPPKADYDPLNEPRVRTFPVSPSAGSNTFRIEFVGIRADVLFKPEAKGSFAVLVDGKPPSAIAELYDFTRVSAFPVSDWPVLLKVGSGAPLVAEDWTLKIDQSSPDGKLCHFTLCGSVTGPDGEGYSTNRFASKSGRVVIEPEDWNLAYSIGVFKRPLPANHTIAWRAVLRGTGTAACPTAAPGTEASVTVAQGLSPGPHVLELRGPGLAEQVPGVRFYSPRQRWRPADAAKYLDEREQAWLGYAKCISCHSGLPYALARPALRKFAGTTTPTQEETKLLAQVRRRVANWTKLDSKEFGLYYDDREELKKQSWGTEAVFNALVLALDDRYQGRSSPSDVTREAFAHLWATQAQAGDDKGSWDWLDFNEPPWGNSEARYLGAALAALAIGSAPGHYTAGADADTDARVNLLRTYLKNNFQKQNLHNQAYGLWANSSLGGILSQSEQEKLITRLLDKQQADGGWTLPALGNWRSDGITQDAASDGYATGLVLHILQTAGLARDQVRIAKGLDWLKDHQASTGAWRTVSLFKKRDPNSHIGKFMSDAATAYSVLALTH